MEHEPRVSLFPLGGTHGDPPPYKVSRLPPPPAQGASPFKADPHTLPSTFPTARARLQGAPHTAVGRWDCLPHTRTKDPLGPSGDTLQVPLVREWGQKGLSPDAQKVLLISEPPNSVPLPRLAHSHSPTTPSPHHHQGEFATTRPVTTLP